MNYLKQDKGDLMGNMIRRFRNLSIKKKLTISYSVIVVFPVMISLIISNIVLNNFMLEKISSINAGSIKDSYKILNRTLDDISFTLLSISNNDQLKEILKNNREFSNQENNNYERYKKKKAIDNIFENIPITLGVYNTRVTVLGENQFAYANWEDYSRYMALIRKEKWYGDILASNTQRVLWIGVTRNLYKENGYFLEAAISVNEGSGKLSKVGVVHISIDEKDIFKALQSNSQDNDIYLIRNNGEIISCENKKEIESNLNEKIDVSKIIRNTGNWYIDREKNGERVVITSLPIDKAGWTLVSVVSYEKLVEPLNRMRNILLGINLIFIVTFLIVALLISNIISKPIIKLSASMKKVEKGNFNEKVEVLSEDEIGKLSSNFNHMLDKVSELLVLTKEQEMLKREAEFEALQAQINPHFLFNTLSSIRWAAAAYGDKKVEAMIHALSVLLRSSISNGQGMIPMEEEINILRHYLDLFQMKQGYSYHLECSMDESILRYEIPHLLLQPIVENSILHGFEGMKEDGIIKITARTSGEVLKIDVVDNGKGFHGSLENILKGENRKADKERYYKSVGLKNINDRIKLNYGESYGLDIRQGEEGGTAVTLSLPYKKE